MPVLLLQAAGCVYAQVCPAPAASEVARVRAYVAARYELAPDISLEDLGALKDTCFRIFAARAAAPKRTILLYASPDLRFLTETLFDTTVDPADEHRRLAAETQKALLKDESPSRGNDNAPVTIVVFSDFQCPYCKRLADLLAAVPPDDAAQVRVVFKHFPLPAHKWARQAAEFAICAGSQASDAFWRLHDFLMANQADLTLESLADRLPTFASQLGSIDAGKLRDCVDNHGGDAILLRDEQLAKLYRVESTPTVFFNGVRTPGFRSAEELDWAIRKVALEEKPKSDPTR
jgi:protein-disulfide isomerase